MKKTLLIGYLALLHAALAACVVAELRERTADHPHIAEMRTIHSRIDPNVPAGAAIFIGDSITEGLATAAVVPNGVNYGIGRQTTDQLLQSLPAYRAIDRAGSIYLLIGTNDLLRGQEAGIGKRLAAISAAIPDKPMAWNGIMPSAHIDPKTLERVNTEIRRLCANRDNCTFIDTAAILTRPDHFTDGIHLSPTGYAAWIGALRQSRSDP